MKDSTQNPISVSRFDKTLMGGNYLIISDLIYRIVRLRLEFCTIFRVRSCAAVPQTNHVFTRSGVSGEY